MRLAPAFALALAPVAAAALSINVNGSNADVLVGLNNCKTLQLTLNWDIQTTPTGIDRVRAMGTRNSASCSTNPPSPAPEVPLFDQPPPTQTGSANTTASALAFGTGDGGVTASCDNPDLLARRSASPVTNFLCVQYFDGFSLTSQSVNVRYALAPPLPPIGVAITPGNRHLRVDWSKGDAADTIATYDVHVVPVAADGGVPATGNPSQSGVTATNADVTRTDDGTLLQNDAGYSITVVAKDTYGNVSAPSDAAVGFPVPSEDFYEHYRNSGGSADGGGGCASGGTPAAVAVLALALALIFRRSRKASGGAALVAVLAFGGAAARADEDRPTPHFLVGFKIDRYDPKVDTESGLVGTPYHDVFGPRAPLRYQLEFDWEIAHPFGAVLLGATAGFWQNYGKAVLTGSTPGNVQRSQDSATLNVIPFGLIATYRFDWLADRYRWFPAIPYAQAGLMSALWIAVNGTGDVSQPSSSGGRGSGWTHGYTTALGIALNLNAIDLELAREAYLDTGIKRTSIFAEYGWTYLSNFHRSGALILSDRAWRFGLAVEF